MAGNRSVAGAGLLKPGLQGDLGFGWRLVILAAICASLLYWPAALVIVLCFALFGVAPEGVVTLGGSLGVFSGMLAWWLFLFIGVLPCLVCVFPWNVKLDGFRQTNEK